MRPSAVTLALLAACAAPRPESAGGRPMEPAALTDTLTAQFARSAAAWNRGDLSGFLSDYAADSATSFMSGGHLHRGVAWIRDHYAPRFAAGASRDSLRFEELTARPLAPSLALVTARYILHQGGRVTASGPFTLVMERQADGWKILHDHSSSD